MSPRMRLSVLLLAVLAALPARAWEFRATPICELSHETAEARVRVLYDPAIPEYAIEITRGEGWPDGPVFGIRFSGGRELVITTDRHTTLDGDPATLTVRDRGFGNVLNGLEFNDTATAFLGDTALSFPLRGAAGQKTFEAVAVTRQTRHAQRSARRTRSGHAAHVDSTAAGQCNEGHTRIADRRHAGIGHERDTLAGAQALDQPRGHGRLVMIVVCN